MATQKKIYTYRNGKKVILKTSDDQFVIRTKSREQLEKKGYSRIEKTSSSSFRVTTSQLQLDSEIDELRKESVVHHAYNQADTGQEFLITDRIIVSFKTAPNLETLNKFINDFSLVLLNKLSEKEFLFQLTNYTGMNPVKLVVELTENHQDLIEYAENDLNMRMRKHQLQLPTDTKYFRQWHLHTHLLNQSFDPRSSSRCEEAWITLGNFGSHDVVVGITDDGCKISHPDFASPDKFASWGYMKGTRLIVNTDFDANASFMYESGSNHGTSCAGVIAGDVNGVLTVGAAPGCRLLPIKWQSDGDYLEISDSKFFTVLQYVSDKVDILSNSWGGAPDNVYSTAVVNLISQLATSGGRRGKGILFLWAAGNQNCPIDFTGNKHIPYTDGWDESGRWIGVETSKSFNCNLTGIPNVMHIAALASNAQRSHYSNYGNGISLCAPTNNGHEYYRLQVTGLGIATDTGEGSMTTESFGGTSSATPLIAGIAALVLSANPYLTAVELASLLKQTASKDLNFNGYPQTPATSYDPNTSWDISPVEPFQQGQFSDTGSADGTWSPWFGHGKADACAAVTEALKQKNITNGVLRIISALVNPAGKDYGNEKVSILNASFNTSLLNGIAIRVNGKKNMLSGQLGAGECTTIRLNTNVPLSNTGATIQLVDASDNILAEVAYTKDMVKTDRIIVFS